MPALTDPKHEAFVHFIIKGETQARAYVLAGFKQNDSNCSRLFRREDVQARIAELQEAAAKKAVKTAADIIDQLGEDRDFARQLEAPAAAISATMGQAKVLGLLNERVEHSGPDGGPIEIADADLARLIAFTLTKAARET